MLTTSSKITHICFVDDFLAKNKYLKDNPDMMNKVEKDIEGSLHNLFENSFTMDCLKKDLAQKMYWTNYTY